MGRQSAVAMNCAAVNLTEAAASEAAQLAPYEYHFARSQLEQAQTEASHDEASSLAARADEYARMALSIAQAAQRQKP